MAGYKIDEQLSAFGEHRDYADTAEAIRDLSLAHLRAAALCRGAGVFGHP